jgi:hypothetical protein
MGLFEFMAPQWAAAEHMRELAGSMRRKNLRTASTHSMRIKACEDDVGFLGLIMFALVSKLVENGALSKNDLATAFDELDAMDGAKDGKIDLKILQGAFGLHRPAPKKRKLRRRAPSKVKLRVK